MGVVLRVDDQFGNPRHFAVDAIELTLNGPAVLVGDHSLGLIGGTGAGWIRATETPGTIVLNGKRPRLGSATVTLQSVPSQPETA